MNRHRIILITALVAFVFVLMVANPMPMGEIRTTLGDQAISKEDYLSGSNTFYVVADSDDSWYSTSTHYTGYASTPYVEFYDSWVSDSRVNVGNWVVVGFKARWNDTLEDVGDGLCAEVYDGTRYYQLGYHPDGWSLMTSYDEVCKKNFTVVSAGYFGERDELNGESILFEQTVENPDVIWDRVIVRQNPSPDETTTQVPEDYTLTTYIIVGGVVVIAVIALALLRRRRKHKWVLLKEP